MDDSITVSFTADTSGLDSGVQDVQDQLSSTAAAAQDSGDGVNAGIGAGIGGAVSHLLKFGLQLGGSIYAVKGLASGAEGLASSLLAPNAAIEQQTVAFKTLLGSTSAAHQEVASLTTFAAQTPFRLPDIESSAQKRLAFGETKDQVIPSMTAIGDTLSAMGRATPAELGSVVDIFGKIQASGKITGGDLMQLSRHGINAAKMLGDQMGISAQEVEKLASKGAIPASKGIGMLQAGMEKTFSGGMAAQAHTFNGLMSTFQDQTAQAFAVMSGPLFTAAESGLNQLVSLTASPQFQQFATTVGTDIGGAMTVLVGGITDVVNIGVGLVTFFSKNQLALDLLGAVLAGVGIGVLAFAITQIPPLLVAFGAWAVAAGAAGLATLAAAAPFILIGAIAAAVVLGIILVVQNWGAISKWLTDTWKKTEAWFTGFLTGLGSFFSSKLSEIGTTISTWAGDAYTFITSPFVKAWSFISGIFDNIKSAISGALSSLANSPLGKLVGQTIHAFATGTSSAPGGLSLVGESGPELLNLPAGTSVTPMSALSTTNSSSTTRNSTAATYHTPLSTSSASAAGAGKNMTQVITFELDGRELAQAIGNQMASDIRLQVGIAA